VNGEKEAVIGGFANRQRYRKGAEVEANVLVPVHGEKVAAAR
jgi:hypothetical protein